MALPSRPQQPENVPTPTMTTILEDCPRFRILVVGKTGVGKSSLINAVFRVDTAHVSHEVRGQSNINDKITSPNNPRVVVHDSMGIEPGGTTHLNALKHFITERAKAKHRPDRLDCVWLCIQIPTAGERVLETGTEHIIKLLTEQGVPFMIVFTQYDRLVEKKLDKLMDDANDDDDEKFILQARKLADQDFKQCCVEVINRWAQKIVKSTPKVVQVSTEAAYQKTLESLVKSTLKGLPVDSHDSSSGDIVGETTQIMFSSAQNIDPRQKMEASVRVGERKYWRGLASSTHFPGLKLDACLRVLHKDIVSCWNIEDETSYLSSEFFENQVINLVDEESTRKLPKARTAKLLGTAAAVSGVLGACTGPVAPIVAPTVFGDLMVATWIYNTYKSTPETLRQLMRYIIDLTNVMYDIFIRSHRDGDPHGKNMEEVAEEVCKTYASSAMMKKVHIELNKFTRETQAWKAMDKDHVLCEIKRLLDECHPTVSRPQSPQL